MSIFLNVDISSQLLTTSSTLFIMGLYNVDNLMIFGPHFIAKPVKWI